MQNWNFAQSKTLYAKWTANTYTVTLNNQSATSAGSTSVNATYNSLLPAITPPTKTNYLFVGYYTGTNSSGTQYYTASGTATRNWNIASNTTLYASWIPAASQSFAYNNAVQTYTIPTTGIYKLEVSGAGGGTAGDLAGGAGGYSVGYKLLESGSTLYVVVGGAGYKGNRYNGGGTAADGGHGGGATHISKKTGLLSSLASSVEDILIVAGGGGGAGQANSGAGAGGALTGGSSGGGPYMGGGSGGGGGSGYIGGVPQISYNGTTYSPTTTTGGGYGSGIDGFAKITFVQ